MKVIVAIDDSAYSKHVLDTCLLRQWPHDTEFRLLSVIEPLPVADLGHTQHALLLEKLEADRKHRLEKYLTDARHKLAGSIPGSRVHFELRHGHAKSEIIDSAVEWSADRIILGAHGHDLCPRFLTGSVSRAVATHAPCSVEIVRPRKRLTIRKTKKRVSHVSK